MLLEKVGSDPWLRDMIEFAGGVHLHHGFRIDLVGQGLQEVHKAGRLFPQVQPIEVNGFVGREDMSIVGQDREVIRRDLRIRGIEIDDIRCSGRNGLVGQIVVHSGTWA